MKYSSLDEGMTANNSGLPFYMLTMLVGASIKPGRTNEIENNDGKLLTETIDILECWM